MTEVNENTPTQRLDVGENVEMIKDAEQIKYEESEEGAKEYEDYRDRRVAEKLKHIEDRHMALKEDIKQFEIDNKIGLDGGIRHLDMPKDSAGQNLTPRQILFCRYYVATNNMMQSLTLAGLPATNHLIMCDPNVRAYIAELTDLRLKRLGYDRDTVLKNLAIIANQDIRDFLDITKSTITTAAGATYVRTDIDMKDLDEVNRDYLRDEMDNYVLDANGNKIVINNEKTKAIKSIKYNDNGKVVMEFHDKLAALKQLANMLDMEKPQKITLNDETYRAKTEEALLNKLKAFADSNETTEENKDTNDKEEQAEEIKE